MTHLSNQILSQLVAMAADVATIAAVGGGFTMSGVRLTRTSLMSFTDGLGAPVEWQTEDLDDGDWADLVVDDKIITVPSGITRIIISAGIRWVGSSVGQREGSILKNGGTNVVTTNWDATSVGEWAATLTTGVLDVVAGETYQLQLTQTSGGALNLVPSGSFLSAFALDA